MKKNIIAAAALMLAGTTAFAYTETKEFMTVTLENGEKVEFIVSDIKEVNFEKRTDTTALVITDGAEELYRLSTIPTLFRVDPDTEGGSTKFGFGTVSAATPAELCSGGYAVELTIAASTLYTADFDLSGDQQSVLLTLYKYTDEGAVDEAFSEIETGTLTTAVNPRNGFVTITLDATLKGGYTIFADAQMKVTTAESLDAMNPAPVYRDELVYFNSDGEARLHANVTGVKRDTYHGLPRFTFTLDNGDGSASLVMAQNLFGEMVFLPDVPKPAASFDDANVQVNYSIIQVASPNDFGRLIATNAYAQAQDNGDGTWTFNIDATNTYYLNSSSTTPGGTPERFVLNYTGTVN